AVEYRALDTLCFDEGEPRRPVGTEAAAPNSNTRAVHVGPLRKMIEPGRIGALGGGIAVAHGVLAGPGHVDHQRRDAFTMEEAAGALAVLLPAIDAPPMHHHPRLGPAPLQLQIADQPLALE